MICAACGSASSVTNTHPSGAITLRIRVCGCGARWSTIERMVGTLTKDNGPRITCDAKRQYYGSDWSNIRNSIVDRDGYRCTECGYHDDLEVHHRVPLRLFAGDFERANQPSNLVTLCAPHHREADAEFRRREGRA